MSRETAQFGIDSSVRVAQGMMLGHTALQGVFDGIRVRQDTDRHAVTQLAGRLGQARRDANAVEAEADALAAEAVELRLLLGVRGASSPAFTHDMRRARRDDRRALRRSALEAVTCGS